MVERRAVAALAAQVSAFHITDRAMRAAQGKIEASLAGGEPAEADVRAYVSAVRRYFEPYSREAESQLRHVDRELEGLFQRQFNLTAERSVVAKRIEAVRGVLETLAETSGG